MNSPSISLTTMSCRNELGLRYRELVQVELGDQHRLLRIRDVEDVNVRCLLVVSGDQVGAVPSLPSEGAVCLIDVGRITNAADRDVAEVFLQLLRVEWIGYIPQRDPGLVVLTAALVVDDQHVSGEVRRVEPDDLHALTDQGVLVGWDEADLEGIGGIADVDDVHAAIRGVLAATLRAGTRFAAPASQVGIIEVGVDGYIGNQAGLRVVDGDLADELYLAPLAGPDEMALIGAMLVCYRRDWQRHGRSECSNNNDR